LGKNAGILAIEILGSSDEEIRNKIIKYKQDMAEDSRQKNNRNDAFTEIYQE
jgi:5-(carboxyamino)imidazole ribonucleotide mutase